MPSSPSRASAAPPPVPTPLLVLLAVLAIEGLIVAGLILWNIS
jgi:hypothetical protein